MEPRANEPIVRRGSGVKRFLYIALLIVILIFGGCAYWKYYFTYSSGERYGFLQKLSYKGNVFKTYEGEMILSSVRSNANVSLASEKFYFSVDDKNVANRIMGLQGKYVTVFYKQKNSTLPWRGDSEFIVDSVKVDE